MSKKAVNHYIKMMQELTLESLPAFVDLCSDNVHFKDPFNDTYGKAALKGIFSDMFEKIEDLKFDVHQCYGEDRKFLMEWTLTGDAGRLGQVTIQGTSAVAFDENDKLILHYDYWDPTQSLYAKLPWIGGLFPWLRSKFQAEV